jgi:hypothetical protein
MIGTILFAIAVVVVALAGNSLFGTQAPGGQQGPAGQVPGAVNEGNQQGNQPPDQGNGNPQPDAPDVIPPIADTDWASGTTDLSASGFFNLDTTIGLDPLPSLTGDNVTFLQFGTSGGSDANVLVQVGEGTSGVTLAQGSRTASGTVDDCSMQVQVAGGTVSGTVSCSNIASYDAATGDVGVTSFHLTFSAQGG